MLNAGQLSLGWQSPKDRARLLSLNRKAHGFQFRVTDKRAGIAMSLMYNIESMALEVLCNDKVDACQLFIFCHCVSSSFCLTVTVIGTAVLRRRFFS